eukprot:5941549-Amphidinium_carterae.1
MLVQYPPCGVHVLNVCHRHPAMNRTPKSIWATLKRMLIEHHECSPKICQALQSEVRRGFHNSCPALVLRVASKQHGCPFEQRLQQDYFKRAKQTKAVVLLSKSR